MLESVPSGYIAAMGGVPSIIIGAWTFLQWWKQSRNEDHQRESADRLTREDRARAAHDAVWQQVQAELQRAYKRIDLEEGFAQHWEAQARAQHGALWEMRAAVIEARQLCASRIPAAELPPEWRRPVEVPRLDPPQATPR